jgi:hypothetical protein
MSLWTTDPKTKSALEDIDPNSFDPDAVTKALEDGGAEELERKIKAAQEPYQRKHNQWPHKRRY